MRGQRGFRGGCDYVCAAGAEAFVTAAVRLEAPAGSLPPWPGVEAGSCLSDSESFAFPRIAVHNNEHREAATRDARSRGTAPTIAAQHDKQAGLFPAPDHDPGRVCK